VMDGGDGVATAADSPVAVSYVTTFENGTTTIAARTGADRRTRATTSVAGHWGIPRVTMNGGVGGLSANGRVLVLAHPYDGGNGELQTSSAFKVFGTKPLALRKTVTLHGDFGFDALSPDGRMLYLIEHASAEDLLSYRVRAYDVRAGKLLRRVIADKRQTSWLMNGMPVARAASADGRWVYTLYSSGQNYPFVHALDTTRRTAVCIGLPWQWSSSNDEIYNAQLRLDAGRLVVEGAHGFGTRFALDTRTFKVTKL
jgi:hypothetical protein